MGKAGAYPSKTPFRFSSFEITLATATAIKTCLKNFISLVIIPYKMFLRHLAPLDKISQYFLKIFIVELENDLKLIPTT